MAAKTALVTGGSRGIGRSTALRLAESGYDVAICYRSSEAEARDVCAKITALGRKAYCYRADVRVVADVDAMLERLANEVSALHVLVNNAGITRFIPLLDVTEADWDEIVYTDWRGPYFCTQRVARWMIQTGTPGVIINVSSIHEQCCFPHASVYGPAKAALGKFTQHAALELAQYGIRVNTVSPGCTLIREHQEQSERAIRLSRRIPLQRFANAREIANAIAFLVSPESSYITGACLRVDGGAILPSLLDNPYC